MSERASTAMPRTCSGDIYPAVRSEGRGGRSECSSDVCSSDLKRPLARDDLVEDCPKAEYVRARIHSNAAHLLGRHISRCPQHYPRLRGVGHGWKRAVVAGVGLSEFRKPEVQNLDPPILRDE